MFELLSFFSEYLFLLILHICHSDTFPKPLTKSEEEEYIKLSLAGDKTAKNKLVEHNLRLVAHIIKKYYHCVSDQDDLVSIGTIGLIKAVNTYNPDKKIKLSSYASRCVENEILMHFRNCKKSAQDISLNEAIDSDKDGNPLTLMDIMATEDCIIDDIDTKINLEKLYTYMNEVLDEREIEILTLRFGLKNHTPLTQREIAKLLNISRSYVSRIEKKALESLRKKYEHG
ncbi:MAG: RNA polymerase sporulation sigma factor SigK [Ruminococcus sp.]|nr:RNA polymerase sporulation sigma factor SigK [Ruminococcus sp.]